MRSHVLGRLFLIIAAMASTGCVPNAPPPPLVVFPPPPDTARIQFLVGFGGGKDVEGGPSLARRLVGEEEEDARAILKPYGVGFARGRIYVCDTERRGIEVLDIRRRKFSLWQPQGEGRLTTPAGCFADGRDGRLYVADPDRGQVVVFDSTGTYVAAFGAGAGQKPAVSVAHGERIWVGDIGTGRVRVYERATLEQVLEFPAPNDTAGYLRQPVGLAVTGDRVFVSDGLQFTVKVYAHDGRFLKSIGTIGRSPGEFARNKGLAVDREGRLYVVDAAFENVQVFDSAGTPLMFIAGGGYQGPGYLYLPAQVTVHYDDLDLFERYVAPPFRLKHLVLVTSQFGPDKVAVYGFVERREE